MMVFLRSKTEPEMLVPQEQQEGNKTFVALKKTKNSDFKERKIVQNWRVL